MSRDAVADIHRTAAGVCVTIVHRRCAFDTVVLTQGSTYRVVFHSRWLDIQPSPQQAEVVRLACRTTTWGTHLITAVSCPTKSSCSFFKSSCSAIAALTCHCFSASDFILRMPVAIQSHSGGIHNTIRLLVLQWAVSAADAKACTCVRNPCSRASALMDVHSYCAERWASRCTTYDAKDGLG